MNDYLKALKLELWNVMLDYDAAGL